MTLYNQALDKTETQDEILQRDKIYVIKLSEQQRNDFGFFNVSVGQQPNSNYYTSIKSGVLVGNIYEIAYVSVDKPLHEAMDYKLSLLANKAIEIEEQGITVSGLEIATDVRSQAKLTTAITFFGRKPDVTRKFKTKNGFASADKATVELIQDALDVHLVAVTANEEIHYNAISILATVEEIEAYDINIGW